MHEINIREELSRILVEEPTNYGKILELSSKLSSFDNENVRFSVDAGVIDRLGTELTAIKNHPQANEILAMHIHPLIREERFKMLMESSWQQELIPELI